MLDRRTLLKASCLSLLPKPEERLILRDVEDEWKDMHLFFLRTVGWQRSDISSRWTFDRLKAASWPASTHPDSLECAKNLVEQVSGVPVEWVKQ